MRLSAGDDAPEFTRSDHEGNHVSLDDFRGRKLVIYFYPRAFTSGCTTESCDFRDRYDVLMQAGYDIVGVSPDPADKNASFREEHELPFRLLSDEDHSMAADYGAWGKKKRYGREFEGLIRSTVVVDEDGQIERAWYNVRAAGHAERVSGELKA